MRLEEQVERAFGLRGVRCERLDTLVNDVVVVRTPDEQLALKLYHRARTAEAVRWEVDLVTHLADRGAPVVRAVRVPDRGVTVLPVDGVDRLAVLFAWAPGAKPAPTASTYRLLGEAAARLHRAADTFVSDLPRESYDATVLVDEQLHRMRRHLSDAGVWPQAVALGERLRAAVADPALDRGVCHMDLTLDNVHRDGEELAVFDLDSAGQCWRALEPYGVLRYSAEHFATWLEGYRAVRALSARDERAVAAFGVLADLRNVAWKLGVAPSSRGTPLLTTADLPGVAGWLAWEAGDGGWRRPPGPAR